MLRHIVAWVIVIATAAGISGGLFYYKSTDMQRAQAAAAAMPEPMEAVASTVARTGEVVATTRAIGTVVALQVLELRNELPGIIAEMGFTSGSIVEQGQLLIRLDTRQEEAGLAAAEAEAQLAKQQMDRRENLRGSPAYSPQEVDRTRSEYLAATARARSFAVSIDRKRIVAPFRARVSITNLQPGAYLDTGTLISRLQGLDEDAYVDFVLPQDAATIIGPGSQVTVSGTALPQGPTSAEIIAEDDSVENLSRTVRLRARMKGLGASVRPGTFVDVVAVIAKPRESVLVPLTAVRRSPAGQHVFVLTSEDGKTRARLRPIETGPVQDKDIVVEKGLKAGEVIAAAGSFKLRDGVLVATQSAANTPATQ